MNTIGNQTVERKPHNGRFAWDDSFNASAGTEQPHGYLAHAKKVSFSPKDVIYRAGEPANKIYEVQSGLVKVLSYLPNGRERILRLHGLNDWIGLGLQRSYEYTAIAISPVEANCISVGDFSHWKTEEILLRNLFQNLKKADIWIEQFSTGCIKSRVARLINFLSEVEYGKNSDRVRLLTCEEMAAILGTTTESVSTVLAEFKRNGALRALKSKTHKQYERNADALRHHAYE